MGGTAALIYFKISIMLANVKVNRDVMCPLPSWDVVITCVIAKNVTPGTELEELSESRHCRCPLPFCPLSPTMVILPCKIIQSSTSKSQKTNLNPLRQKDLGEVTLLKCLVGRGVVCGILNTNLFHFGQFSSNNKNISPIFGTDLEGKRRLCHVFVWLMSHEAEWNKTAEYALY